uniref:Serine protease inhibitor dipetalogastin-like n=1 Tax=Crassostrea virginica TaxID=6565 RepID=A0A8B8C8K9_CRAVI|nr:serine protease inhibitor dipetalogastin-like [Crassostrea virginica]
MQLGIFIALMVVFALSEARSPPGPVACTADESPVCGVDNETYGNACMARAKGVAIAGQGECKVCACPRNMEPVCGVNKKTYDNDCLAKCAGVTFFPGPCKRRDS